MTKAISRVIGVIKKDFGDRVLILIVIGLFIVFIDWFVFRAVQATIIAYDDVGLWWAVGGGALWSSLVVVAVVSFRNMWRNLDMW